MTREEHTMRDHRGNTVTLPEQQRQQVISYVKHQGAKSTDDLVALVDRGEAILNGLLEGVTEEQAGFRPSEDAWSIKNVLRHVDASLAGSARLIQALGRGERADATLVDPSRAADDGASLTELRRRVAAAYEEVRAAIRGLGPGADLAATARHPFFEDLNCKEWAAFVYVHCGRDHTDQIGQVKAHADFPR